jgi:hypothetical protein
MAELTDVELLAHLEGALSAPPVRPDDVTMARLYATLEELAIEDEPVNIATAAARRSSRQLTLPRRTVARSSVIAASALAFALSAGVAAAAVATNTLPGPTRAIAYDLGLPVTSPSLFRAEQSAAALRQSIVSKNLPQEGLLGQQLIGDLQTLNFSDLTQIRATADTLLVEVGLSLPTLSSTSATPVTPTGTVPVVSVPKVRVPAVSVPGVTVPSVSVSRASVPSITVPSVSTPVTVPIIPLPKVTIPGLKLPGLP